MTIDTLNSIAVRESTGVITRERPAVLVSNTVPWPDIALIEFLRQSAGMPRVYWANQTMPIGLAGCGAAAVLMADGPDRFRVIREGARRLFEHAILQREDAPAAVGPRLFGGFAFQPEHRPTGVWAAFPAAYFVLPRYQLTRFEGRTWLTVNRLVPAGARTRGRGEAPWSGISKGPQPYLPGASPLHTNGHAGNTEAAAPADHRFDVECPVDRATWCGLVSDATRRIDRGELDKVVLARACDARLVRPVQPADVLARLEDRYPDCYRFLIEPVPGHAFFGATPELLVEVAGTTLRTVAMAGSTARGDTPESDAKLAEELMSSPKERGEHAFVVDAIEASLRPLAKTLRVPERPSVRRLRNIQHLQTIIQGELAEGAGVLPAVEALHPTPAVGGVPLAPALQMIVEAEPVSRGWYASPVGWMDPQGNGLFSVAIRSAVSVGARARLYAGAGIVADSDPEREWEETELKFRPMLEALR